MNRKKGKFIVIDGTNGSGKATQTKKLVTELKHMGKDIMLVDFPRYGKRSAALAEDYLNGKFGSLKEVGPYKASIFFACDRFAASNGIKEHLEKGGIVISNRYTPSNMAHQTAQIRNYKSKEKYLDWVQDLEYNIFQIPKPDLILILINAPEKSQAWVDKKGFRAYVQGQKRDLHESDLKHLRDAANTYRFIAKKYNWEIIEADQDIEIIHKKIMRIISKFIN